MENQGAAKLARNADPEGKRTIGIPCSKIPLITGVLTKADTVTDPDAFERWAETISGNDPQHRLFHGFYVTMQRATPQETGLQGEKEFFITNPLWARFPSSRIGCSPLLNCLAVELSRLIKHRYLPSADPSQQAADRIICRFRQLADELGERIKATEEKMDQLPHPIGPDVQADLCRLCYDFVRDVALAVKGDNELALKIARADSQFKRCVWSSTAQFGLAGRDEIKAKIPIKTANDLLADHHALAIQSRPVGPRKPMVQGTRVKHKTVTVQPHDSDDDVVEIPRAKFSAFANKSRRQDRVKIPKAPTALSQDQEPFIGPFPGIVPADPQGNLSNWTIDE